MQESADSLASLASLLGAVARTPRVPPVLPGTEVGGRYLVVGVIGAGGMGVVYRARDLQLEREVAIKLCSRGSDEDDRHLMGEAVAMARLAHPNVTTVYEVGRFQDDLFLVMELVTGTTMRRWLAVSRRPWRDTVRLYLEVAAGLHAVHRAGLVHGDFKPDNVLIGDDGRARIADFGLSRTDEGPATGGTPRYMAPEVRAGWFAGQRSDQYSFCVALGEALGARRPRGVAAILARGLAEDPDRRFESMDALRAELARRLARRARAFVAAATLLALCTLGVAGVWVEGRAEANRARALALRRTALEFYQEQGKRELGAGDPQGALVYLAAALDGGVDRPALRFLLARGLAALEQSFVELSGHGAAVTAVVLRRVGPQALVGTSAGAVLLYDTADGRLIRAFAGHRHRVTTLALDPLAARLASAAEDGTVKLWDVESGALLAEMAGHGARFLPDGKRLLTWGRDGTARVWDDAGRELARYTHGAPINVALWRDDVVFTAGDDGVARAWKGRGFVGHGDAIIAADVDDTRLVTGARDGSARVWDRATGALLAELRHPEAVGAVRFLPGGRVLTGCDDGSARVWDVANSAVLTTFAGHTGPITALDLTADGGRLITASADASVRVWDVATGREIAALTGHHESVAALATTGGNLVLTGSDDGTARVWAFAPGQFAGSLSTTGARWRVAWYAGRDRVVAIDENGAVATFHARVGGWQQAGAAWKIGAAAGAAAVNPDGSRLATVDLAGRVHLWDLDAQLHLAALSSNDTRGMAFSADGETLAAWGTRLDVWHGGYAGEILADVPVAGAVSPRGERVALAFADGRVELWDARALRRLSSRHAPSAVRSLAFDASGTLLALAGNDASVTLWDGFGAGLERRIGRHGAPAQAVRFAPDGQLLFSLGSDRRVRVWDVASGTELEAIAVEAFGGLDIAPDGNRLLVRQGLGAVSFWDVSREPRAPQTVAGVVHCLVPMEVDEANRLAPRAPDPRCGVNP